MYFLCLPCSNSIHPHVNSSKCAVRPPRHTTLFVFRCMCVCVFVFVSSVNYLQHWQCLSIVDSNGKYVSLWLFFGGNSIQHLSTEGEKKKNLLQRRLITHMCFGVQMQTSGNKIYSQTLIPPSSGLAMRRSG